MGGWNRFLYQYLKDAKLWLFFLLYLTVFRLFFILYFHETIEETSGWPELLRTVFTGLRYDSKTASVWIAIPFMLSAGAGFADIERWADRFRIVYGSIFVVFSTVAFALTISFYQEYNDQFNHFLFNLYYDDTRAILSTIWAAYHPIVHLVLISIVSYVILKIKNSYFSDGFLPRERVAAYCPSFFRRVFLSFLMVALLAAAARGSFGSRPLKLHDAAATSDEFLNKAVLNPYIALSRAFGDHVKMASGGGLGSFLPDKDTKKAARAFFGSGESFDNLDQYMMRYARGPKNRPPRHVFLILMESFDSWPMLRKYDSLGLTVNLKQFAHEGLFVERFLPAGTWTVPALCTLIAGLPYTVPINYQDTSRAAYPSALAETFRRLGYRTRLFYGGFLRWEKIGDFGKAQGFDETYGALHIKDKASMDKWGNDWGVDDEDLFNFALARIEDDRPSFNFILTTANHPPYSVNVKAKGFPLKEIPADVARISRISGTEECLTVLGHLWYSDHCIGEFVRKAEKKLPAALFAMTGDHYGRRCISARPDFFERSAVPFVLYGKDVLKKVSLPEDTVGSHIDIGPTLIELSAPKGFPYYALGRNLLVPRVGAKGIGFGKVIGRDYIADVSGTPVLHPIPGRALPEKRPDLNELKTMVNNYNGIGWWRVKRGPQL